MAGTPQARKLGLQAGMRVAFDAPPDGWQLTDPPGGLLVPDEDEARSEERRVGKECW